MFGVLVTYCLYFVQLESELRPIQHYTDLSIVSTREVWLAQRHLFPKVSDAEIELTMKLIEQEKDQRSQYIISKYGWLVWAGWEDDICRRLRIWRYYRIVSDVGYHAHTRTVMLEEMRRELGDEDYFKGRLPPIASGLE